MIEERLKTRPPPPPPPHVHSPVDASAKSNSEVPSKSRDVDSDVDILRSGKCSSFGSSIMQVNFNVVGFLFIYLLLFSFLSYGRHS